MKITSLFAATLLAAGVLVAGAAPAQAVGPCQSSEPPPDCPQPSDGPPSGRLDSVTRVPAGIRVTGWASDPDAAALPVRVTVDDVLAGELTADKPYAGQGNAGFDGAVPAKAGSRVCVTTVDAPNTKRYTIGCRTWQVPVVPFGALGAPARSGSSVEVSGWAIDPDSAGAVTVVAEVDGRPGPQVSANLPRTDVAGAYPAYGGNHGFSLTVPEGSEGDHRICLAAQGTSLGCQAWTVRHNPYGGVDAVVRTGDKVKITGWAIDPDQPAASTLIDVGVDGKYLRTTTADLPRPDGTRHGFEMTIDAADTGTHEVCALAWNLGPGDHAYLGCRSYNRPGAITPPSLIAQPGPGRIQVGWTTDATLSRVVVARSVDGGAWTEMSRAGAVTTWTDTDMRPGLRHCYRVTVGNDRPSEASADVCATALLPAPPAPVDVRVTGVTDTSIALAFTDRATTETGYQLEVRGGGTIKTVNLPAYAGTGSQTTTVSNLKAVTPYTILVKPVQTNAAEVADEDAGKVSAWTSGAPVIETFSVGPATAQACRKVDARLTFRINGAARAEITRNGAPQWSGTSTGSVWTGEVSGGDTDGNETYVLSAYDSAGRKTTRTVTLEQEASQVPLVKSVSFFNNRPDILVVGVWDASQRQLYDFGQLNINARLTVQVPPCERLNIEVRRAVDRRTVVFRTNDLLGYATGSQRDVRIEPGLP